MIYYLWIILWLYLTQWHRDMNTNTGFVTGIINLLLVWFIFVTPFYIFLQFAILFVPREGRLKTTAPLPAYLMPSFKLVLPPPVRAPTNQPAPPLLLSRARNIWEAEPDWAGQDIMCSCKISDERCLGPRLGSTCMSGWCLFVLTGLDW